MAIALVSLAAGNACGEELQLVPAKNWCVTRGRVEALGNGAARVTEPKMRAVAPRSDGNAAELRFTYDGPSRGEAPLASGEMRRQIGIKLRAADGCNLLYVMWRIEPKAQLVVSIKRNPGKHTHAECGANGYQNLRPMIGAPPPIMTPGSQHSLRAQLEGTKLRVWADHVLAWEGDVGEEPFAVSGPAGVRTDNAAFTVELYARPGNEAACGKGGDED
jgi:hypothetical protein